MGDPLGFDGIEAGFNLAPITRKITQESINWYAEAANDFNPIYVDPEFARTTPYGGTIAHGTTPLAFISTLLNEYFGPRWVFGGNMKVSFRKPIRPGDTVITKSTVLSKKREAGKKIVELSVSCENQKGDVIVTGKATVSF